MNVLWRPRTGAILLLLVMPTLFPGLGQSLVRNTWLVRVITGPSSIENLRSGWYGVGLPTVDAEQSRTLLTRYADVAEQPICRELMQRLPAYSVYPVSTPLSVHRPLDLLLQARMLACNGLPDAAAQLLMQSTPPTALDGALVDSLLAAGRRADAEAILRNTICDTEEDWCAGYVGALLQTWYVAPGAASSISRSTASPVSDVHTSLASLQLIATPGVTVRHEYPLIVEDALRPEMGDNYIAYTNTPLPTDIAAVRLHIFGEALGTDNASCLVARLVYYDHTEAYLTETTKTQTVKGEFHTVFTDVPPAESAYVTPRVTFDARCLAGASALGVYAVELELRVDQ